MLTKAGLSFFLLLLIGISYAQVKEIDSNIENHTNGKNNDFYTLKYKKSGRNIKIEIPPPDTTATSTPINIDPPNLSGDLKLNDLLVDEDALTALAIFPVDISIRNQTCEVGSILNMASFTICNNEKESLILINKDDLEHSAQERGKFIESIAPESCEDVFLVGDDSDLQFDCSGIFSITFRVRLEPSNRETYFNVPIRSVGIEQ